MLDFFNISIYSLISFLCFIPAIVVHEVSHGFVAYKLGDPTAKSKGRLTLNPLAHVDIFGTVIMPIMLALAGGPVFGYAKPVPYNPMYFKNIRKGEFYTGMAGPASNILMALVGIIIARIVYLLPPSDFAIWVVVVCYYFSMVNLCLAFFNLIPLPPLDGSSIIALFLSDRALRQYYRIQRFALPVLFVVIFIVPYFLGFNIIGLYLDVTAGAIVRLAFGF
ncbi:MAG: site-2 protease family protein [Coriobacteriia bacterium]|nr:site-2 protease family protein [Coriobacteriia bacterium]